ncbi:MAG: hypothetical protein V2J16_00735, partial [Thermoleophilia bacterium]|nr:hypothetical protein [Thermoleophilia bacterium]
MGCRGPSPSIALPGSPLSLPAAAPCSIGGGLSAWPARRGAPGAARERTWGASLSDTSPESGFGSVLQLGRTLRLVWGIAPRWTLATLVLAVVQGVLPLLGLLLLREIVDAVVAGVTAPDKSAAFATV